MKLHFISEEGNSDYITNYNYVRKKLSSIRKDNDMNEIVKRLMENKRLNESKSPIYHGTTPKQAMMIIQSNEMKANISNETETIGVSFTRNPREAYNQIILKIDQETLSYNYKIDPVYRDGIAGRDLAEERVPVTIKNIRRYLLEVDLNGQMHLNIIRNRLVKNFGNHDYVLKNDDKYPDSWQHQNMSHYYYYQLILTCEEYNIRMGALLLQAKKYIEMFLNDEHDIEYEEKLKNRRNNNGRYSKKINGKS